MLMSVQSESCECLFKWIFHHNTKDATKNNQSKLVFTVIVIFKYFLSINNLIISQSKLNDNRVRTKPSGNGQLVKTALMGLWFLAAKISVK